MKWFIPITDISLEDKIGLSGLTVLQFPVNTYSTFMAMLLSLLLLFVCLALFVFYLQLAMKSWDVLYIWQKFGSCITGILLYLYIALPAYCFTCILLYLSYAYGFLFHCFCWIGTLLCSLNCVTDDVIMEQDLSDEAVLLQRKISDLQADLKAEMKKAREVAESAVNDY